MSKYWDFNLADLTFNVDTAKRRKGIGFIGGTGNIALFHWTRPFIQMFRALSCPQGNPMQDRRAPRAPLPYAPPKDRLDVAHVDDDIIVLRKPSGLLTTEGRAEGMEDCLLSRARLRWPDALPVHRLDLDTSGVVLFVRNAEAQAATAKQFEARRVTKTYVARVAGKLEPPFGEINLPIRKDYKRRPIHEIHPDGKPARTLWHVDSYESDITRVKLTPITGRTHQLRVHMAYHGHPILGDRLYAPDDVLAKAERLQLHAASIALHHPVTGEGITFSAECPF